MSLRIGQQLLLALAVVGAIGDDGVLVLVLSRHRLWRLRPADRVQIRWILIEPHQMVFTGMLLIRTKAETILVAQRQAELAQPDIVVEAGTGPDGRRVLLILNREVAALLGALPLRSRGEIGITLDDVMSRVEKLGGLKNHLDDMLITMPTRTARCLVTEIEDIHAGVIYGKARASSNFADTAYSTL